ncbi:MAG: hypothetical protein POELPBGB_02262 [Bacteroidia bacterium]|nr:hypothetical protein [Bacteroidia bacterium]
MSEVQAPIKRLGKVATELNQSKDTVLDFLKSKGFNVENNPNAKLDREQYNLLVKEFQADKLLKEHAEKELNRLKEEEVTRDKVEKRGIDIDLLSQKTKPGKKSKKDNKLAYDEFPTIKKSKEVKSIQNILKKLIYPNTVLIDDFVYSLCRSEYSISKRLKRKYRFLFYEDVEISSDKDIVEKTELIDNVSDLREQIYNQIILSNNINEKEKIKIVFNKSIIDFLLQHIINSAAEKTNFFSFISNENITPDSIELYKENLNWNELSRNRHILIEEAFILRYETYINFKILSSNENVLFTQEIIEKYIDRWDIGALLVNKSVVSSYELIKEALELPDLQIGRTFISNPDFWEVFSSLNACWNHEIFFEYLNNWSYRDLLKNPHFFKSIVTPLLDEYFIEELICNHKPNLKEKYISKSDREELWKVAFKINYINVDYVFAFGKYKGAILKDVILEDLDYVLWCITNLNHFCLDYNLFHRIGIDMIYKPFISPSLIIAYERAKSSKASLILEIDVNDCIEKSEKEACLDEVRKSDNDDANRAFYAEFDEDFHEDML